MVYEDSRNKSLSKQPKPQLKPNDSKTKVNFSDYVAYRYFANQRVIMSVRVDKGLAEQFKRYAKACYGSICRAVEVYMVNFIEAAERGVNFCYTSKPLRIEKVVIERNLRSRRKLEFEGGFEDDLISSVVKGSRDSCAVCGRPSFARGINKDGSRVFLCRSHFRDRKKRFVGWAYVKELCPYE